MVIADGGGYTEPKAPTPTGTTPSGLSQNVFVPEKAPSYPPPATCPPGERLYKVSRGGESQYVSAGSEEEAAEQLGYKAGYSAFVTSVMSPEAYPGGVYPTSKEVTAVSGEKFVVPTEPKLEATREYARLYGSVPSTNAPEALKASYQEQREVIRSQMEAGTYVSPLSIEIPEVKALAEKNNLSYSQALTEAKLVADQAIRNYSTTGSCGRLGMTLGEAKISSAYLSAIGRTDEADIIRQYYVGLGGTLENQLKKAEDVDLYGVYKDLKPYRKGVSYDLVTACSEGACSESGLKLMGFSPDAIAGAMATGGILGSLQGSKFYSSSTGEVMLGPAIAAGVITEAQARQVFGKESVDEAVKNAGVGIGAGVGTIGFGSLGLPGAQPAAVANKIKTWSIVQEGGGFKLKLNYTDGARITEAFGSYDEAWDYVIKEKAREVTFVEKVKSFLWGMTPWKSQFPEPTWEVLGTPEFTLATVGLTQFAGPAIPVALTRLVPTSVATWLTGPGKVASQIAGMTGGKVPVTALNIGKLALTGGVEAFKSLVIPTAATTLAGTWASLSYKPPSVSEKGSVDFQSFKASTEYSRVYNQYMEDAGSEYSKAAANLKEGETLGSKEEYLKQAKEDFDPAVRDWFVEQVGKGMEYQPGLMGVLGRGGAVLNLPVQQMQALPAPGIVKGLATGIYQVMAPLSVTQQLYGTKGPAALTTMIPYYGPITAATALTWKEQPWYGKALGVGFTALPFVSPLAKLGWATTGPSMYAPFPKELISYGPKGEVLVHLGKEYGWQSYKAALEILKTDVGLAQMYQTPSVFGARPGFWPEAPGAMVLGFPKRLVSSTGLTPWGEHPSLVPAGLSVDYGVLGKPVLTSKPSLGGPGLVRVPYREYADTARPLGGPSSTAPLVVQKVGGEIPGVAGQMVSLGSLRMPKLIGQEPIYPTDVKVHMGWAGTKITQPPLSLEPYVLWRDFGLPGRGRVVAPPLPVTGTPSTTYPSTFRGTPEALQKERAARGASPIVQYALGIPTGEGFVIPRSAGTPSYTPFIISSPITTLGVSPGVSPFTTPSPVVTPGVSPFVSPFVPSITYPTVRVATAPYVGVSPGPASFPVPSPTPAFNPFPSYFTPEPTVYTPIPTPPEPTPPQPKPPWVWPLFGVGGLKSSRPFALGKGGILGIGKWKFSGFKVSGPHPLALGTTGYTWMGGKEAAWGAKREAAPKKSRGLATGGLVRVV